MLQRIWLLFAQTTTVGLAFLFVVSTMKPQWLSAVDVTPRRPPLRSLARPPALPVAPKPTPIGNAVIRQIPRDAIEERTQAAGSYADAAARAMPSVVSIYTSEKMDTPPDEAIARRFFGDGVVPPPKQTSKLGSGVIVTDDGYILTNNHVVAAAQKISVACNDGRNFPARIVGTDPDTDIAVLKIDAPHLPVMAFGRSENLRVGDVVLAIGNPFGVGQTVTMGIVSALGRRMHDTGAFESFIQTDAPINQGNSGGALVDTHGRLVGINTLIYSQSGGSVGLGFAIPTTIITQVMDQIIHNGYVRRGYFGVEPFDITPDLAKSLRLGRSTGVFVYGVLRGGPANRAGMRPGDIVLTLNGKPVPDRRSLLVQIAGLAPGSISSVRVLRGTRIVTLRVRAGRRPVEKAAQ